MKQLLTINGTAFEAGKDTYRIGRGSDCDILLPEDDQMASRMHARLSLSGEGLWVVADLGSVNGTFVNGAKIQKATVLKEGDCIQAGGTEIVLGVPAPKAPPRGSAHVAAQPSIPAPAPPRSSPTLAGPSFVVRPSQEAQTTASHQVTSASSPTSMGIAPPSYSASPTLPPIPSPTMDSDVPAFLTKQAKSVEAPDRAGHMPPIARPPDPYILGADLNSGAAEPPQATPPLSPPQETAGGSEAMAGTFLALLTAVGLLISFALPWFSLSLLGLNIASPNYFQILFFAWDLIRIGRNVPMELMLALVPGLLLIVSVSAVAVKGSGQGILLASVGGLGVIFGAFMISRMGEAIRLAGIGFYLFLFVSLCGLALGLVRFLMHSKGEG